eukprot:scaffold552_cov526-Prasinococcus_capsulatus_cf.AAC.26
MSTFGQRNSNRAPLFAGTSSKDADSGGGEHTLWSLLELLCLIRTPGSVTPCGTLDQDLTR